MALGTAMGGRRIIETVGRDMVILAPGRVWPPIWGRTLPAPVYAGYLPVSTTHAKTAAILGAPLGGRSTTVWLPASPSPGCSPFPAAACWGFCWPASSVPLSCGILMPGTIF
ncbi:inorganic phosphate transporter [Flavonifractor plautii]|nr:inorganic phosphate transporter [Flavonifractor plautii]